MNADQIELLLLSVRAMAVELSEIRHQNKQLLEALRPKAALDAAGVTLLCDSVDWTGCKEACDRPAGHDGQHWAVYESKCHRWHNENVR